LNGQKHPVEVEKTVSAARADSLSVVYRIKNTGRTALSFVCGVEFNFSVGQTGPAEVSEARVTRHVFHDSWRGIDIELGVSPEASLVTAPVETVSESESGMERTYQGLAVLLQRPLTLAAGASAETAFDLTVR
jgi:hypothetical protein